MSEPEKEEIEHPDDMLPGETEIPNGFPEDLEIPDYGDEPEGG